MSTPLTSLRICVDRRQANWPKRALPAALAALTREGRTAMARDLTVRAVGLPPEALWVLLGQFLRLVPADRPPGEAEATLLDRGGPERTGVVSGACLPEVEHLKNPLWSIPGGVEVPSVVSAPLIVGDVVLVSAQASAARDGNALRCLDLESGAEIWSAVEAQQACSTPAVSPLGLVAVGTRAGLCVLSAADGEVLWSTPGPAVTGAPLLVGERVFWADEFGSVQCADLHDGERIWLGRLAPSAISAPLAASGRILAAVTDDGLALGMDIASGAELWRQPLHEHKAAGTLALAEDKAVICHGRRLSILNLADGRPSWSRQFATKKLGSPAVGRGAGGETLVVFSDEGGHLQAKRLSDGAAVWGRSIPGPQGSWSAPVIAGAHAVIGDEAGVLHAFDVATGTELWWQEFGSAIDAAPALGGGRIVLGFASGALMCLGQP